VSFFRAGHTAPNNEPRWLDVRGTLELSYRLGRALPPRVRQLLKPAFRQVWYRRGCRRLAEVSRSPADERLPSPYRVVCFPVIDWELRTQRPQQLLARLSARGCPVFYLRNDFRLGRTAARTSLVPPNVFGLRLPGPARMTIYRDPPSPTRVSKWLDLLETVLRPGDSLPTVALVQWPFWMSLAFAARDRWGWPVIYDCLDEHSASPAARPETVEFERLLIEGSDLVTATSRVLQLKCSTAHRPCMYLPNAADFEHFWDHGGGTSPLRSHRPVVGYIGALAEWFDVELVRAAAMAYSDWRFELVGLNSGANLGSISRLRNVRLLGERPYDDLPSLLRRFDVALIPFRLNALTRAANPVKFYEYLAAGKPVVSSCLPELEPFRDLVYLAPDRKAFVRLIGIAAREAKPELTAARIRFARQNDWSHRVAILDQGFRQLLAHATTRVVRTANSRDKSSSVELAAEAPKTFQSA